MKKIKRFIRVDFENGNHYVSAVDEFNGKSKGVRFKIDSTGVLITSEGVAHFHPAGSYKFVTWE